MTTYENLTLDEERALYGIHDAQVKHCVFDGPADGESALKETRDLSVSDCSFKLRYPFWHTHRAVIERCEMTDTCRAALWYDEGITIEDCTLGGIKAVRECRNVTIRHSEIVSPEFGWFSQGLRIEDTKLVAEYAFLKTSGMTLTNFHLDGKYSFQYTKDVVIKDSVLNTKDAFWHSENVTVMDSVVKGEYLGWYSKNLHLIRCKIIGTQPLCYAQGLVLADCTMEDTDLSFERSDVEATVRGEILSVKDPMSGLITADAIGEVILDEAAKDSTCKITIRSADACSAAGASRTLS